MERDLHGSLVTVSVRNAGDAFDTAASIGATTLSLYDVSDFDEDGGSVTIAGTVYTYDSADMEADTIHLTSGLIASAAVDDRVDIWDPDAGAVVSERVALVAVDDQDGDPVSAVIDHSLRPFYLDSTLAYGQSVSLAPDGVGQRMTEIHGKDSQFAHRSSSTGGVDFGIDLGNGAIAGFTTTPTGTTANVPLKVGTGGSAVTKLRFGSTSGTTDASGQITVSHGLGAVPTAVIFTDRAGNNPFRAYHNATADTSSVFGVTFRNTTSNAAAGAGVSVTVDWLALV